MEDAAKADEPTPGADGAEQKKQYLLDRIATSEGFKDAKAHKEEDAAPEAAPAADAKATEEASSGEDASPPKRRRPLLVDNLEPLARHALKYGELVVSKGSVLDAHVGALVNAANEGCRAAAASTPERLPRRRRFTGGEARGAAVPRGQRLAPLRDGDAVSPPAGPSGPAMRRRDPRRRSQYHSLPDGEGELERGDAYRGPPTRIRWRAPRKRSARPSPSLLSAGIFRGRQSLDTILAISVGAVADGAYEGWAKAPSGFRRPTEKLKAAAAGRFSAAPAQLRPRRSWAAPTRA